MTPPDQTLAQLLQQWLAFRTALAGAGAVQTTTLKNQRQIVGTLTKALGAHPLSGLRKSHVELYVAGRRQSCGALTVQGEVNVLRQALNWCVDEGLLAQRPKLPTVRVDEAEKPLPSAEAFRWVLAAVAATHARALEFMLLTGVSPHELERIQVRDRIGNVVRIGGRPDFRVKTPQRRRDIPLNGRASDIWWHDAEGGAATDHVFPTRDALQKAIVRARSPEAPAGVEEITPKSMRAWFSSQVADHQPEHVLQRLLGHKRGSRVTRRHYIGSSDERLVAAVEEIAL